MRERELERQHYYNQQYIQNHSKSSRRQQQQQSSKGSSSSSSVEFVNPFYSNGQEQQQQQYSHVTISLGGGSASSTYSTSSQSSTQSSQCSQIETTAVTKASSVDSTAAAATTTAATAPAPAVAKVDVRHSSRTKDTSSEINSNDVESKLSKTTAKIGGFGVSTTVGHLQYQPLPQQQNEYTGKSYFNHNNSNSTNSTPFRSSKVISNSSATTATTTVIPDITSSIANPVVSRLSKLYHQRQLMTTATAAPTVPHANTIVNTRSPVSTSVETICNSNGPKDSRRPARTENGKY